MKKMFYFIGLLVCVEQGVASTTIWGPYGAAIVNETSNGYTISNLNGGGTTVIERNATGYSVITPQGTTIIEMSPNLVDTPVVPVVPVAPMPSLYP